VALVHVSTDYVFSGDAPLDGAGAPRPYVESDPTGPRSAYGEGKLAGERQVLAASPRHAVVRSSWLFGVHGRNFVATMLALASDRDASAARGAEEASVRVVTDQVGCPTWTGHLAPAMLGLIEREISGLVHLAGTGQVSWNGFAREIFRQAELACKVEPATTAQMARPAPRPAWSALASEREDVVPMPDWRDGLAGYLAARAGMMRP
jgi:dTDP-4-dehydrorhamnose reductase